MRRRNVAYIRVARKNSGDVEYQKKVIDEYTTKNNITIDYYYIDDGYSGTTLNRPALQQMLRDVKSKKITDRIIYVDLSRLGRSFREIDKIIYQTSKRTVKLISIKEFENSKTDLTTFFQQQMRKDNLERIKKGQKLKNIMHGKE